MNPRDAKDASKNDDGKRSKYRGIWEDLDAGELGEGDVMHLGVGDEDWEEIKITIDSGAVGMVGPKKLDQGGQLCKQRHLSRGMFYRLANDTKIAIHGKKTLKGCTKER